MIRAYGVLVGLLVSVLLLGSSLALGAEPQPTILVPGDPRSDGQGPGLVGDPLVVFLGVVALGVIAAAATALVLRFHRDD